MKDKIRVGLLLDSYFIPAWIYKSIELINTSLHSEIVLSIIDDGIKPKKRFFSKIFNNWESIFMILYAKADSIIFKINPSASESLDIRDIINCNEIKVKPKKTKFSDIINEKDTSEIKTYNLDVIIRVGFRILRGSILESAKLGVWSYHHGDNTVTTDSISITRNNNRNLWKSTTLLPRSLKKLHELGDNKFSQEYLEHGNALDFYSNKLFKTPKNSQIVRLIAKLITNKVKKKLLDIFYFNQWYLLFKIEKNNKIATSLFRYKEIVPPKDRYWADPFIVYRNNKYYVFLEEVFYKDSKGMISVLEIDAEGNYTEPQIVLKEDYHFSFPFIFEENNNLYMIPETSLKNRIELYKCEDFPLKWQRKHILMDNINASDTIIFKYNNKYWLFTNIVEVEGASSWDELFLFYSDDLFSNNWTSHIRNPIVSDVKTARCAGNIISVNGEFYRPSQNSSGHYGRAMSINKIKVLNENEYEEVLVSEINPNWSKKIFSTHTINYSNGLTIIDAQMRRKKFF